MLVEVCDICKNPLTSDDYKNNFGIKMKLTKKYKEYSFADSYTVKKKFKLCNHCKEAIAIAIKEYSEFMRRNEQSNLIPKFYTVEDGPKVFKRCTYSAIMSGECKYLNDTDCGNPDDCKYQITFDVPG